MNMGLRFIMTHSPLPREKENGESKLQLVRPFPSTLYIPASKMRVLEKVTTLAVNELVFDFEDAVTSDAKSEACEFLWGRCDRRLRDAL